MNVLAGFVGLSDNNKDIISNMLNSMSPDLELESKIYTSDSCVLGQKEIAKSACNELQYSSVDNTVIVFNVINPMENFIIRLAPLGGLLRVLNENRLLHKVLC